MNEPTSLDKLKLRIQALRAKTQDNGCTEAEALMAAAKVAELLDRHDLSLSDVELRETPCEPRIYATRRKQRTPLDYCISPIANFCDCKVWREKTADGEIRYVFFGLRSDTEVAHYMADLIDNAVRSELGRYKTTYSYQRIRHQERHVANASFTLGMSISIGSKLNDMKAQRDSIKKGGGRDLVVLKTSIVETEMTKLDLKLRPVRRQARMVSPKAYEAGGAAGASFAIHPGLRGGQSEN